MAGLKQSPVDKMTRELVKALQELLLPLKRRVMNHDEHIRYLLTTVKAQAKEIEALKAEIGKLNKRIQWSDEA